MVRSCAVAVCKNTASNCKERPRPICFHTFPNDVKMKKLWFTKCYRKDRKYLLPRPWDLVCSEQFKSEDYERDLSHELLNIPPRKPGHLKVTAIPSINLTGRNNGSSKPISVSRDERLERTKKRDFLNKLRESHSKRFHKDRPSENALFISEAACLFEKLDHRPTSDKTEQLKGSDDDCGLLFKSIPELTRDEELIEASKYVQTAGPQVDYPTSSLAGEASELQSLSKSEVESPKLESQVKIAPILLISSDYDENNNFITEAKSDGTLKLQNQYLVT